MNQENEIQSEPQSKSDAIESTVSVKPIKDKRRHYLAAFFLSFFWGTFGIDRFYLGKIFTGILKLLTFGGFGLWTIIDLVLIMSGAMHDKQGNELIDAKRYKKFANVTVLIFALGIGVTILASGLSIIYAVNSFMESGVFQKYIDGVQNVQQLMDGASSMNNIQQQTQQALDGQNESIDINNIIQQLQSGN